MCNGCRVIPQSFSHLNEVTDDHREKFAEGNMWSYLQEQAKAAKNLAESAVDALAEEVSMTID